MDRKEFDEGVNKILKKTYVIGMLTGIKQNYIDIRSRERNVDRMEYYDEEIENAQLLLDEFLANGLSMRGVISMCGLSEEEVDERIRYFREEGIL